MVVNAEETFDNPDEYHIITKRGKAIVSGNVVWAQSTLKQLIGEDGKMANVDFYDSSACSIRGISLEKFDKKMTLEEMNRLLDLMAFYKLNYLKWSNEGMRSVGDVAVLRQHAQDLGITIVTDPIRAPNADFIDIEMPNANQIFLQTVSEDGGWFYLRGIEANEIDALRAFAERYWRGGNAGEGIVENGLPDELSTAGTRLSNFMEKVAVHRERFKY